MYITPEQTSHQQPADSTFLSEQTNTSHQPSAITQTKSLLIRSTEHHLLLLRSRFTNHHDPLHHQSTSSPTRSSQQSPTVAGGPPSSTATPITVSRFSPRLGNRSPDLTTRRGTTVFSPRDPPSIRISPAQMRCK
jgi:hypothetical protein